MCNKENKTVLAHRDLGKYIKEQFGEELSEDHNLWTANSAKILEKRVLGIQKGKGLARRTHILDPMVKGEVTTIWDRYRFIVSPSSTA